MSVVEDTACVHGGNQKTHASETNIPLKYDGKDARSCITKPTKMKRETLPVNLIMGSLRLTPSQPNDDIERIRNLKTKSQNFENLQS